MDRERFTVFRCYNSRFSVDKDVPKRVFLFVINERIRKVLSERTQYSFGGALYKSSGIKLIMHGRIPVKFEDHSLIAVENTLMSTQNQHHVQRNSAHEKEERLP